MAIVKGQAGADSGPQEVAATPETWFCSDPAQGKLQRPSLGSIPDPSLPEINTNPASPAWVQEETSQQTQHHACHPCALLPLHATSCALEYKSARKRCVVYCAHPTQGIATLCQAHATQERTPLLTPSVAAQAGVDPPPPFPFPFEITKYTKYGK